MKPMPWRMIKQGDGWYLQNRSYHPRQGGWAPIGPYDSADAAKQQLESLVNPDLIVWEEAVIR